MFQYNCQGAMSWFALPRRPELEVQNDADGGGRHLDIGPA